MRYPQIGKQPTRTVSVPQLSGGLNLRDSVSMVADNQLTESLNMWFKDGVLKTRPGLITKEKLFYEIKKTSTSNDDLLMYPYIKDGGGRVLAAYKKLETDTTEGVAVNKAHYKFFWIGKTGYEHFKTSLVVENIVEDGDTNTVDKVNISFVAEKNGKIYVYTKNESVYVCTLSEEKWEKLEEINYHIPTVATNLKPFTAGGGGDMLESYNLLSPYYKAVYSTVDNTTEDIVTTDDSGNEVKVEGTNYMEYELLMPLTGKKDFWNGKKVTATIINKGGVVVEHEVTLDATACGKESEYNTKDNLMMGVNGIFVWFEKEGNSEYAIVKKSDFIRNNMTITAPCPCENKSKVFGMTRSVWFGGAAGGLNGGGRLFLCGNKSEPSLLQWSSLNNPLYFPENNYAYVGSSSSKLCTFGKQDETLVLFKENETYYTHYVQNGEITADQLKAQSVIDYEASSVYFPIIQLNDSIGCDCPDSVQLCRNRLVWTHSNGKVYSLVTQSQYNERNIFEISEMIRPELRNLGSKLKNAISADWEGYYVLALGNKLYLMDYNSYGYQYIYSYSKAEDANVKIPWYIWEVPENMHTLKSFIFGSSHNMGVISCFDANSGIRLGATYFDVSNNADCDSRWELKSDNSDIVINHTGPKIPCRAQTKIFDFSAPNIRKNIKSVGLSVGNNGGTPINVKFITDCGNEEDVIVLDGADTKERTAGFLDSRILYPCIKSVLRFGVEFSGTGFMAIEGINLSYRYLGGAR